jgi:hypothetical protein
MRTRTHAPTAEGSGRFGATVAVATSLLCRALVIALAHPPGSCPSPDLTLPRHLRRSYGEHLFYAGKGAQGDTSSGEQWTMAEAMLVRLRRNDYFFSLRLKHVTPQTAPSTVTRHGSPCCAPGVNSQDRSGWET